MSGTNWTSTFRLADAFGDDRHPVQLVEGKGEQDQIHASARPPLARARRCCPASGAPLRGLLRVPRRGRSGDRPRPDRDPGSPTKVCSSRLRIPVLPTNSTRTEAAHRGASCGCRNRRATQCPKRERRTSRWSRRRSRRAVGSSSPERMKNAIESMTRLPRITPRTMRSRSSSIDLERTGSYRPRRVEDPRPDHEQRHAGPQVRGPAAGSPAGTASIRCRSATSRLKRKRRLRPR